MQERAGDKAFYTPVCKTVESVIATTYMVDTEDLRQGAIESVEVIVVVFGRTACTH